MFDNHKAQKNGSVCHCSCFFSPASLHSLEHTIQIESEQALGVEFLAFW